MRGFDALGQLAKAAGQKEGANDRAQPLDPLAKLSWLCRGRAPVTGDYLGAGRQQLLEDAAREVEALRQLLQDWADDTEGENRAFLQERTKQIIHGGR